MTTRFRLSSTAFAQQQQLKVPMVLVEYLAQPGCRGAAAILSARSLSQMPAAIKALAQPFLGLYITADGHGCVTSIARMTHRLAHIAQDDDYGLSAVSNAQSTQKQQVWPASIGA